MDKKGPHAQPELRGKSRDLEQAVRHAQSLRDDMEKKFAEGKSTDEGTQVIAQVNSEKKRARTESARQALEKRKIEAGKRRLQVFAPQQGWRVWYSRCSRRRC